MEQLSDAISESAVLSAVINNGADCFLDLSQFISCDTFTDEQYSALWKCLTEIFKGETKKTDIPSILVTAKDLGLGIFFDNETKQKTLKRIANFPLEIESAISFAKRLKKLEIARTLNSKLELAQKSILRLTGEESLDTIINCAEKPIFEITDQINGISKDIKRLGDTIEDYITYLKENRGKSIGIPTGFPEYDKAIGGGLRRGSVGVICARMKVGKSAYTACIGLNAVRDLGIPILAIDTEMTYEEHNIRLLANLTSIDRREIESGEVFDNSRRESKITEAKDLIQKLPYDHISVAGKSFDEIVSIMKRWVIRNVGYDSSGKTNPCLIFYDYLKIMDAEEVSNMQEYQVLGLQMTRLHNFAVEFDLPILAFAQVNRDGLDNENSGIVAGSDRIGWLCSHLSLLKLKSAEEIAKDTPELGNRKLVVLAARHGPGHQFPDYIHIGGQLQYSRLEELGSKKRPKKVKNTKFDIENTENIVF